MTTVAASRAAERRRQWHRFCRNVVQGGYATARLRRGALTAQLLCPSAAYFGLIGLTPPIPKH